MDLYREARKAHCRKRWLLQAALPRGKVTIIEDAFKAATIRQNGSLAYGKN